MTVNEYIALLLAIDPTGEAEIVSQCEDYHELGPQGVSGPHAAWARKTFHVCWRRKTAEKVIVTGEEWCGEDDERAKLVVLV